MKVGDKVVVYDACRQCNVTEPIVRIEGDYIYTKRENWLGYDERLITKDKIKKCTK